MADPKADPYAEFAPADPYAEFNNPPSMGNVAGLVDQRSKPPPLGEQFKRQLGLTARIPIDAATSLPLAAAEGGAGLANTFTGGHYSPTQDYQSLMSRIFPQPEGGLEKGVNIAGTMMAGAALPSAPAVSQTAPANFVSSADAKRQAIAAALKGAQDQGYVVPPATTNPTVPNVIADTVAGKGSMGQAASVKNADVTQRIAAEYVGLNPDTPITAGGLAAIRKQASQSYAAVRGAGEIGTDASWKQLLDGIRSKFSGVQESFPGTKESPILDELQSLDVQKFNASHAIDKIDELRDAATKAFRASDNQLGSAYRQLSNGLEAQIERGLDLKATLGLPGVSSDLVSSFRNARQLIAKTHTVEDALNPGNNTVSMPALVAALKRDEPISGALKVAAQFGASYPKANQDPAKFGSVAINHLTDVMAPMLSMYEGSSPLTKAAGFALPIARYGARAWQLGPGQANALPQIGNAAGSPKTAMALAQALAANKRNAFSEQEKPEQ